MKTMLLIGAIAGILGQTEAVPPWLGAISDLGVVIMMLVMFWGTVIKDPPWLIRYGEYRNAIKREEFYRDLAHRSTVVSERSTDALTKTVDLDARRD